MILTLTLSSAAFVLALLIANRKAVADYLRSNANQNGGLAQVEEFFLRA